MNPDELKKQRGTHSAREFNHGICPECAKKLYPENDVYDENEIEK